MHITTQHQVSISLCVTHASLGGDCHCFFVFRLRSSVGKDCYLPVFSSGKCFPNLALWLPALSGSHTPPGSCAHGVLRSPLMTPHEARNPLGTRDTISFLILYMCMLCVELARAGHGTHVEDERTDLWSQFFPSLLEKLTLRCHQTCSARAFAR